MISFFVAGEPAGSPRPRCVCVGPPFKKFPKLHSDDSADEWKKLVEAEAAKHRPETPLSGPAYVALTFMFVRPTSHFTRKKGVTQLKADAPVFHTDKPDRDNLDKAILDTLKEMGGFFASDDCQVCDGPIKKLYTDLGGMPGVFIKIKSL